MIEKIGPTVHKGGTIYNIGGGGGGGDPVTPVLPENISLMEYYNVAANPGGYFILTTENGIWINRNDIVYTKFELDLSQQYYDFRLYECYNGSFEMSLMGSNPTELYEYNMTTSRQWHTLNLKVGSALQYVIRTNQGYQGDGWSISRAASGSCDGVYMARLFFGNRTPGKFYKLIVADENNIERYSLLPVFNTQTNAVGILKTDTQEVFYPNIQSGFTAGPLIPF